MITSIIVFCICLSVYSAMGFGGWGALFASFGTVMVLNIIFVIILTRRFKD